MLFMAAVAEVANVTFLSVKADGETAPCAPRLSISQLSLDGHVHVAGSGGAWGATRVIEASTDLVHWTPISTNLVPPTACRECPALVELGRGTNRLTRPRFF